MTMALPAWLRTWHQLGALAGDEALHRRVCEGWSEPHRRYHTLAHLRQCLRQLEEVLELAQRPAEVALALWFHDAIYDVQRHDNEQRCADWARTSVLEAGLTERVAARVHALVLATAHQATPQGTDAQLLVDIDLSVLGALPERFDTYDAQIRQEYAHVPDAAWRAGRSRFVRGMLARPSLYTTPTFQASFEARARENLQRALDRLAPA